MTSNNHLLELKVRCRGANRSLGLGFGMVMFPVQFRTVQRLGWGTHLLIARRIVTPPSTPLVLIWVMVMSPAIDGLVDPNSTLT